MPMKQKESQSDHENITTRQQFEEIKHTFGDVCSDESANSTYLFNIANKVIYEQKAPGEFYKKVYHPTAENPWEVERIESFDFKEIEQVASELSIAHKYGVSEDRAFGYDSIQPLLSEELSEKEKFAFIQVKRDEVICDWAYEEKGPTFINDYKEELYAQLKSKVINGHTYYQMGEEMEIMVAGVPDPHNEYTLTTFDETGPLTDYTLGEAEDVTDFLTERHAIACNKEAMTHVLNFAMPDMGNDVKHQQHLINNDVMRQTFEAKKGHPMTRL